MHRVGAHRGEALTVGSFMIGVGMVCAASGLSARLGTVAADSSVVGAIVGAFATVWLPIAVIDFRRCTRETALRARVEEDLERHTRAAQERATELAALRSRVVDVLEAGGPRLFCQPIVEIEHRRIIGFEALSRFDDAVPPDQWFADAASAGVGVELELAAITNALRLVTELPPATYLSVNASPEALRDPRLLDLVTASDPRRVVIEVTEHDAPDDYDSFRSVITELQRVGARVAVDDTGAGFASFRHIVDLKPDIIKIDRSLVRGIDSDPARMSLMVALVAFATEVGATLIAEGVEKRREDLALRRWGVRFAQGWLYGKPQPHFQLHPTTAAPNPPSTALRPPAGVVVG